MHSCATARPAHQREELLSVQHVRPSCHRSNPSSYPTGGISSPVLTIHRKICLCTSSDIVKTVLLRAKARRGTVPHAGELKAGRRSRCSHFLTVLSHNPHRVVSPIASLAASRRPSSENLSARMGRSQSAMAGRMLDRTSLPRNSIYHINT